MQMRPSGTAGVANQRQHLTLFNPVTHLNQYFGSMGIAGFKARAMRHDDDFTIIGHGFRGRHDAAGCGKDRGAGIGGKIQTFMEGFVAVKRIDTPTVAG